ncbi:MAG: hypothetical protein JST35_11705 [Armatimonadetes bacterium]|nr:hypothetical protein [Armatimonadota bacterium]
MIQFIFAQMVLGQGGKKPPAPKPTPVTISINAKDGSTVQGVVNFRVRVDSEMMVSGVEFYVNGKLRATDDSSPYDFQIDTLNEADGPIKLKFVAFTAKGSRNEKLLTLTVDNKVSGGPDIHVTKAGEFIASGEWEKAIYEGRIALKAKPNYVPARMILARAYAGKKEFDSALAQASEAVAVEPNNIAALDLVASLQVRQVFGAYLRGGEKELIELGKTIRESLSNAASMRRKSLDARVDGFTSVTKDNLIDFADTAIGAGRYGAAIMQLQKPFEADQRRIDIANRLAFAQLRAGRLNDADRTVSLGIRYGKPDAYTYALKAVVDYERGRGDSSKEAMKNAILNDSSNSGVRTAQVYLAVRQGQWDTVRSLGSDLVKDEGQRAETNFYLSVMQDRTRNFADSRKFMEACLLAEPASVEMYCEQGLRAISIAMTPNMVKKFVDMNLESAKGYFEVARTARPDSAQALTGLALAAFFQDKDLDAMKFAEAAVAAGPGYAAGLFTYAGILQERVQSLQRAATNKLAEAGKIGNTNPAEAEKLRRESAEIEKKTREYLQVSQALLNRAADLDPDGLGFRQAPSAKKAYDYFLRRGLVPYFAPPSR